MLHLYFSILLYLEDVMDQVPLKVSLTLPSVEQSGASSEPVTDDISEISTGGL